MSSSSPSSSTAEAAILQVAETLSSKVFAYTFPFSSVQSAIADAETGSDRSESAPDGITKLVPLQVRANALALPVGYFLSPPASAAPNDGWIPTSVLAPSAALPLMRRALVELSTARRAHADVGPLVLHVNAADYSTLSAARTGSASGDDSSSSAPPNAALFSNYAAALGTAADTGIAVLGSKSAAEVQHMSVLATGLSLVSPTVHLYDGLATARKPVPDGCELDQADVLDLYKAVSDRACDLTGSDHSVHTLFAALNNHAGTNYSPFEYVGHENPEEVLAVFGAAEASLAHKTAHKLAAGGVRVGVISVRLYRPFIESAFLDLLPPSVKSIAVLGQVETEADPVDPAVHSTLFADVLATVRLAGRRAGVHEIKYFSPPVWTPDVFALVLTQIARLRGSVSLDSLLPKQGKTGIEFFSHDDNVCEFIVWDVDTAPSNASESLAESLSHTGKNISVTRSHNNLIHGGTTRTDIRLAENDIDAPYPVQAAAGVFVAEPALFNHFDITASVKLGGTVVLSSKSSKPEDLEKVIPEQARLSIAKKGLHLYATEDDAEAVDILLRLADRESDRFVSEVAVPTSWSEITVDSPLALSADVVPTSFLRADHEPEDAAEDTQEARRLALINSFVFPEAYASQPKLRPDLSAKTSIVTVKSLRRLTPETYDRNVFHIEFELGDTGITYAIGEALGVHAQNDPAQVDEFIGWYGLDKDALVSVPTAAAGGFVQTTTVFQALLQHIDIFGSPPKRFYEALARFATNPAEKEALGRLATPAGGAEFKRRAELDFVTYADILAEFRSAHPDAAELMAIVAPMKRREYSIASSQRVTPDSVSLLIVTVEWEDSRGRSRFGQATRYLNSLSVGSPVVVSVKPSVMKLPADPATPIIMAGLGTGLAPFRAFVQERALQKSQGVEIGPVLLYLGSRHQREEYLYGEEWEAYQSAGVITLLGCAFSRDQEKKIYIQDRMRESIDEIKDAYIAKKGSFYLCGPTWPVPDVTAVLQEAIESHARENAGASTKTKIDSRRMLEEMKEEGRYVLEVY